MKLELKPGFWRLQNGHKGEIVGRSAAGDWIGTDTYSPSVYSWDRRGKCHQFPACSIAGPWREPIKGEARKSASATRKSMPDYPIWLKLLGFVYWLLAIWLYAIWMR